jgi:alkylhydroperoxidase family enzyme
VSREHGIDEQKLMDLSDYTTSASYSREELLALRLADEMCNTPTNVPVDLFRDLQKAFTEDQIVELVSAIAWENYRARSNRVFDSGSDNFSAGAFCPLPVR